MRIDFYLQFNTKFGESLAIIGDTEALGNNDVVNALEMKFLNESFWHASIEIDASEQKTFNYRYVFTSATGSIKKEGEKNRNIDLKKSSEEDIVLIDLWNDEGYHQNAFYTAPFKQVYFRDQQKKQKKNKTETFTHTFKVKAPLLTENESVCVLGNQTILGNWDIEKHLLLTKSDEWYTISLELSSADFPIFYKYAIYNTKKEEFIRFEEGDNRMLQNMGGVSKRTIIHDAFIRFSDLHWKGAGVAIPVFSLRSNNSFGIGEFTDIKLLVDWANETGLKLIQLLPINDTSATNTWKDSYPYAAISAFALHPIYINLAKVAGKKHADVVRSLSKKQKHLNSLPQVDYEQVIQFKVSMLKELFNLDAMKFQEEDEYKDFYEDNKHWLVPYAAFCFFRDKYGTSDYSKWKTNSFYNEAEIQKFSSPKYKHYPQIAFYYFTQYHLHLQLRDAVNYAHKNGVALKGDIPIGIYRYGCDAWTAPELYNMEMQAGAPPDDFTIKGQNWGFPTYNWREMEANGFEWWRQRFHQMSNYFDAFRIDHILGFFRIWSIPIDSVEGILGRFIPALPVTVYEFGERGIWFDYERFCKPYITEQILLQIFGGQVELVKSLFIEPNERGTYDLKEEFNTQRKVDEYLSAQTDLENIDQIRQGLFDLITNVILYERPGSDKQEFDFRILIELTSSYQHLDDAMKEKVYDLYIDYFYRRQDEFWAKEAMKKLPALKEATDMLICGEDLGMVPHSVPTVMKDLGILSLEIQRMPKDLKLEFFHPKEAPYLSVITPSTHDMSTIRGWWEEDRERTQLFFNTVLSNPGTAPFYCEPWVNRAIVLQHLYSPAMWSIFQLQDILGMSEELRRENPHAERINDPAIPNHYWNYRMHITLEDLVKEKEFNKEFKDYINNSGRA
ncbi:MAG TPA: 4-alpha-glucanotransferase [Flavisolibacter sp.]|nr:4-alpha-glucanotransferase [Flavisolibacter sp.]